VNARFQAKSAFSFSRSRQIRRVPLLHLSKQGTDPMGARERPAVRRSVAPACRRVLVRPCSFRWHPGSMEAWSRRWQRRRTERVSSRLPPGGRRPDHLMHAVGARARLRLVPAVPLLAGPNFLTDPRVDAWKTKMKLLTNHRTAGAFLSLSCAQRIP
jgi:hypothetical protein